MATMYSGGGGVGGVIRAPIQRVDAQGGIGTLLQSLGQVTSQAAAQKMAEDEAAKKAAAGAPVATPPPTVNLTDADLGPQVTGGNMTLPTVGGPYGDGEGVPGFDTIMANLGVQSMVGDYANVGTPPPSPVNAMLNRRQPFGYGMATPFI